MITWTNQTAFIAALREYQAASKKSYGDIIGNEAQWFARGLYDEFKKLSPTAQVIAKSAIARGFKMGRKTNSLITAARGVSQASITRAKALLDGQKSDWFKVTVSSEGAPVIRKARFSARKGNKLLRGGRFGNKFAPSALRASQFEADNRTIAQVMRKDLGLKQLNERALATAVEIGYRSRAAKGHLMGVQWLPQVYRTRKSSVVKSGPLVVNTIKGKRIGSVDFINANGELVAVRLTGLVPGTGSQNGKHSIVNKVAIARIADRRAYISRKLAEARQKAVAVGGAR